MIPDHRVVPFKRWHYDWLADATLAVDQNKLTRIDLNTLIELENASSFTYIVDGTPIACAGTIRQWPGRSVAWAYLSYLTGPIMRRLTKEVKQRLDVIPGRIEFTVRCDFPAGHRWAKMIGFEVESPCLKAYGPEGEDHVGYVRFN